MADIEGICEKVLASKNTYIDVKSDLWWKGKAGPHISESAVVSGNLCKWEVAG